MATSEATLDTQIDRRFKRAWEFFGANATELLLATLVVLAGSALVLPAPWFALNLLQEITECLRTGRKLRWQASFDRPGLLLRSWGLTLAAGLGLAVGLASCVVPGALLGVLWLQAPALVADGRPVLAALSESAGRVSGHGAWTSTVLNALVLAALVGLSLLTGVVTLLTLPLGLTYLALCHLDHGTAQQALPASTSVEPVGA